MVKNLDFNCVRNFWQKAIVYMISLIYIFWIVTRNMFSINHDILVVQYLCQWTQWLHYDNPWKKKNQLGMNLISLNCVKL